MSMNHGLGCGLLNASHCFTLRPDRLPGLGHSDLLTRGPESMSRGPVSEIDISHTKLIIESLVSPWSSRASLVVESARQTNGLSERPNSLLTRPCYSATMLRDVSHATRPALNYDRGGGIARELINGSGVQWLEFVCWNSL